MLCPRRPFLAGTPGRAVRSGSTQTVVIYVYNQFYSSQRLGYGSAVAFLLFAVILGLTMVQLSVGRRRGRSDGCRGFQVSRFQVRR